jgi:hypothetical protein
MRNAPSASRSRPCKCCRVSVRLRAGAGTKFYADSIVAGIASARALHSATCCSSLMQQQLQQPQQSSVAVALATPMSVDGSATCGPHHAILLIGYVGLNSLSDQHDRPLPDEARRRCAQLDQLLAAAADHDHPFLGATAASSVRASSRRPTWGSSCSSQASPCGATSRRSTTHCSPSSQLARALLLCCKGLNKDASDEPPASFQERFVGIGRFIRRPSHDQ